jgi:3-oxoacyl-[acyl-carrier protein] reductase
MKIDLNNQVAIVTGAANGIGRVIAEQLLKEGAKLSIWDNDADALKRTYEELKKSEGELTYSNCDVSKESDVEAATKAVVQEFGRIDILVANAGVAHFEKVVDMDTSIWDEVFSVNTRGVFNCSKIVGREMIKNKYGRIIVASSFAAILPSALSAAYSSSKSALVSLTRVLSAELGQYNITVNAYAAGMIPTAMSGVQNMTVERQEELLNTLSIKEWGRAEDIASLVVFLASDQARYITGAHIDASGGKFAVQFAKYAR